MKNTIYKKKSKVGLLSIFTILLFTNYLLFAQDAEELKKNKSFENLVKVAKLEWLYPQKNRTKNVDLSDPEIIKRINIVVLSDGYITSEFKSGMFNDDVKVLFQGSNKSSSIKGFFDIEPYKNYKEYFNIFTISLPSKQSGISHPQNSSLKGDLQTCLNIKKEKIDNVFESSLDYGRYIGQPDGNNLYLHRLISFNEDKVDYILDSMCPFYDQAVILVNSPYYGGAGGKVAVVTTNKFSSDIFFHEIGHSLFLLADEYVEPNQQTERYNKTKDSNSNTIKWRNWLNTNGIGIFPNGVNPSWFKPSKSCKMEKLAIIDPNDPSKLIYNDFCSVCKEAIVLECHAMTDIIWKTNWSYKEKANSAQINADIETEDFFVKINQNNDEFPIKFEVFLNKPTPNTLSFYWMLNNKIINNTNTTINIKRESIDKEVNELGFYVIDESKFLRVNSPNLKKNIESSRRWVISANDYDYSLETDNSEILPDTEIPVVASVDPNDIIAPKGVGEDNWLNPNQTLYYTIRCENDPVYATAPAQSVYIKHPLSSNVNPYSISLGDFGIGNHTFQVPPNKSYYSKQLDLTEDLGVLLNITAGLDADNGEAYWYFDSVDPSTGLRPQDPLLGLLPVNDTISRIGEGFVSYYINIDENVNQADSINAVASIIFDDNEAIETPKVYNLVDVNPPVSTVSSYKRISENQIQLTIDVSDEGSGVKHIALFYSINEKDYKSLIITPDKLPFLFEIQPNTSYQFYSLAEDLVGNREVENKQAELRVK